MALKVSDVGPGHHARRGHRRVRVRERERRRRHQPELRRQQPVLAPFFQPLVDDAVAADAVCVAAAGNAGTDTAYYPAACDSVLAVAATTVANQRATFSNWGYYVDIAAPGQDIWSTLARNYTRDASNDLLFQLLYGWNGVDPYMYNSGTSFACPVVAGAVALVRGRYPGVPAPYIIDHMIATGDAVAYSVDIGPRLNVYNALLRTWTWPTARVGGPPTGLGRATPNPLRVGVAGAGAASFAYTLARDGDVELAVYDLRGRRVVELERGARAAGAHRAQWTAATRRGRRSRPGCTSWRARRRPPRRGTDHRPALIRRGPPPARCRSRRAWCARPR